jgi:type IV secretory pathway TraG/TraD family ATPase VirD4
MNRQPKLYRTPKKPGYLGGYNWRATCFGLLLLALVNFGATQFIAARFEYQPALGPPLVHTRSGGIYEPFAWMIWGWHNSTSQDPQVRQPLFEGEMLVFAGSLLCVAVFFVAANRRSQKLMENADDLHGSARWATERDIRATGLTDAGQGVYVRARTGTTATTTTTRTIRTKPRMPMTGWLSRPLRISRDFSIFCSNGAAMRVRPSRPLT